VLQIWIFYWGLNWVSFCAWKLGFHYRLELGFFCAFENLLFYCITARKSAQTVHFVKIRRQGKNVLVFWLLICTKSQMNFFCLHIPISKPPNTHKCILWVLQWSVVFNRSSNAHHGQLRKLHTVSCLRIGGFFGCSLGDEFIHLISMDTQYHLSNSILCTSFPTN
jgi:hypothetical protein